MMTFATFLEEVQTALNHLYNPAFQPSRALATLLKASATPWSHQMGQYTLAHH